MYEGAIQDLIDALGRLPGIGPKSAQRIAYHLLARLPASVQVDDLIQAGMIGLNRGAVSDPAAPFGGMKQSGLGREGAGRLQRRCLPAL